MIERPGSRGHEQYNLILHKLKCIIEIIGSTNPPDSG